jgi:hypothetical protein
MIVDNTFLYNCSRNVVLINEFPFIRHLHVKLNPAHPHTHPSCCREPKNKKASAQPYNEVKKIIATMTQPSLDQFKKILKVEILSVTYTDELGKTQFIER